MESIDNYLTFEVKKEIADRYFGFRKVIEEDTEKYLQNILECSHELEITIGHDLIRIYTLLNNEQLIEQFLALTHLPHRLFVDSYINTSPVKNGIFIQQKFRGLTRKGCLNNMFFDGYAILSGHIVDYRKKYTQLQEDQETIVEQINIFYRKNDIETIFHFLRSLDSYPSVKSPAFATAAMNGSIGDKLRILPPPPAENLLPEIPEIPKEKKIRAQLKLLVAKACLQQPMLDLRSLKKFSF